ncbi:MAG: CidA/LrgA family protein [Tistlia sp.]|uniref:CidA/LrgA family protein n=1 Tax=Tistlia sp. TaxID=3057121 RepID=UPI0034A1B3AD
MLGSLTLLLLCQLLGEVAVRATALPLPGPVVGMALLFVGLALRGEIPPALAETAGALLRNLSLLFVPAGVGVMLHLSLIGREWLPIAAALIGSAVITVAVTALVLQGASRLLRRAEHSAADSGPRPGPED